MTNTDKRLGADGKAHKVPAGDLLTKPPIALHCWSCCKAAGGSRVPVCATSPYLKVPLVEKCWTQVRTLCLHPKAYLAVVKAVLIELLKACMQVTIYRVFSSTSYQIQNLY